MLTKGIFLVENAVLLKNVCEKMYSLTMLGRNGNEIKESCPSALDAFSQVEHLQ